jgi:hypothetical protein
MKHCLLILLTLSFYGCVVLAPKTNEKMLPNGDWEISHAQQQSCKTSIENTDQNNEQQPLINLDNLSNTFKQTQPVNTTEHDKQIKICIEKYKKAIANRSQELCGERRFELYGCINSESGTDVSGLQYNIDPNNQYGYYSTCYVRCVK